MGCAAHDDDDDERGIEEEKIVGLNWDEIVVLFNLASFFFLFPFFRFFTDFVWRFVGDWVEV